MPHSTIPDVICLHPAGSGSNLRAICNTMKEWLTDSSVVQPVETDQDAQAVLLVLDDPTCTLDIYQKCLQHRENNRRVIAVNAGRRPLPFQKVWQLLASGVADILSWEADRSLAALVEARIIRRRIIDRILASDKISQTIIGSSPAWKYVLRQVIELACFSDSPVLIMGDTGTGKELVARLIHELDRREDKKQLVLLDCSSIVPELSGSEFFGHEKGAFTNAISMREGAFARADGGTLFLDEVGELPLSLQAALLRVVQEGTYKRVGGNNWSRTHFRMIAATNRDLMQEAENKRFRWDLYYRISSCIIRLPPLSERKADIPALTRYFLCKELKLSEAPEIDRYLIHYLQQRTYSGNVRELQQLVRCMAYKYTGKGPLTIGCLPEALYASASCLIDKWQDNGFTDGIRQALADNVGLKEIKRIAGEVAIQIAVEEAGGNLQAAAEQLAVSDRLVQNWWKNYAEC